MTTTITDDETETKIKPPRLGRSVAFGSEYGRGLSVREYIATACLQGRLAAIDDGDCELTHEDFATMAVRLADALLAELAK